MTSRFSLDNSRPVRLYPCPSCQKKQLKIYVDLESRDRLPDYIGRCNRESKCGYHYTPGQYFKDNPALVKDFKPQNQKHNIAFATEPSYIPVDLFERSLKTDVTNNFLSFIEDKFGERRMQEIRNRFCIGTSKHWPGSSVFWQLDECKNVRTGKVMLYDLSTGKRVKKPFNHIDWVHSILTRSNIIQNFNLSQCLFGLHQLAEHHVSEIAIVESEKTAIISSLHLTELTWMASGGLSMLSPGRLKSIKKHPLILYPDLGGFEKWKLKADELSDSGFKVVVSDVLEKAPFVTAEERAEGYDIGDYLLKINIPETPLEKLIKKNPMIETLINRLDLKEAM